MIPEHSSTIVRRYITVLFAARSCLSDSHARSEVAGGSLIRSPLRFCYPKQQILSKFAPFTATAAHHHRLVLPKVDQDGYDVLVHLRHPPCFVVLCTVYNGCMTKRGAQLLTLQYSKLHGNIILYMGGHGFRQGASGVIRELK